MPATSRKTAFMDMLRTAGIRYIFGNPGTSDHPYHVVPRELLRYQIRAGSPSGDGQRLLL